jgi:outer membrane protein OmpA-like peptidoglycan-associated protein
MLENLRELVTPAILFRMTGQTGESESSIARGFDAAIPALAATVAGRSDDRGFINYLSDLATRTTADPDPLRNAGQLAPTASGIDTSTPVGRFLSSLFGPNLSTVSDNIGRFAGIRGSSGASVLSMAAPLVLAFLGRLMRSERLDAAGLADRLRSERLHLMSALPAGFELPGIFAPPQEAETRRVATHVRPEKSSEGWGFPLMLLLTALGIGGLIWWGNHSRVEQQARTAVQMPIPRPVPQPNTVGTTGSLNGMVIRNLPGNVRITIPTGSTEDRLSMYLGSAVNGMTTIDFDRIAFAQGSAALSPGSLDQISNVAAILRAYPESTVTIAGHTDNMGKEGSNMALSRARAAAVADKLTDAGVAASRVHAEGFGATKPVADNSTEQGRAENRRVALEVNVKGARE